MGSSFASKIERYYGNQTYFFDLIITLSIFLLMKYILNVDFIFVYELLKTNSSDIITFLSIIIGFLFTSFTLLLTFNTNRNNILSKLKKHKEYKRMLYNILETSCPFFSNIKRVG